MIAGEFLDPRWPSWAELVVAGFCVLTWMLIGILAALAVHEKGKR